MRQSHLRDVAGKELRGLPIRLFEAAEAWVSDRTFLLVSSLVVFYLACRLPELTRVDSYWRVIYPIVSTYLPRNLFGPGGAGLAHEVISPANVVLMYPPLTYYLTSWVQRLSDLLALTFLLQVAVPVLAFLLFRTVTSTLLAWLIGLVSACYWTFVMPHPDYTLQPLMLLATYLLVKNDWGVTSSNPWRMLLPGLLTGLVILLKHNAGLAFACISASVLLFASVTETERTRALPSRRWPVIAILVPYAVVGILLPRRELHVSDFLYYLFPYFAYLGAVAAWAWPRAVAVRWKAFLGPAAVFLGAAAVLPIAAFLHVGSAIGYRRYLHALFGLGFEYLPAWDVGVLTLMRSHVRLRLATLGDLLGFAGMATVLAFYAVPFAAGAAGVIRVLRLRNRPGGAPPPGLVLGYGALAVFSVLVLFPLEDYRNLHTRVFLSLFGFLACTAAVMARSARLRSAFAAFLLVAVMYGMWAARGAWAAWRDDAALATPELREVIDVPVNPALAEDLDGQAQAIKRLVGSNEFYLIHFGGMEMAPLLLLNPPDSRQYYIETRESFLSEETTQAIIRALRQREYVVVESAAYRRGGSVAADGPFSRRIVGFLRENFDEVGAYEPRNGVSGVYGFVVLRSKVQPAVRPALSGGM